MDLFKKKTCHKFYKAGQKKKKKMVLIPSSNFTKDLN